MYEKCSTARLGVMELEQEKVMKDFKEVVKGVTRSGYNGVTR